MPLLDRWCSWQARDAPGRPVVSLTGAPARLVVRVFHFLLFFSECLISTGFPLFHLFNEVWCPLFPSETDIMIRSNSPKFSVFAPFGVKVTHVNTKANRALTP